MRVLLIFLLMLSCRSGVFEDLKDDTKQPSDPAPEVEDEEAECKTSCASCAAWQWGEWSPAENSECEGEPLQQQRIGTRTCPALCNNVQCLSSKIEVRDTTGTKDCDTSGSVGTETNTDTDINTSISRTLAHKTCAEVCNAWQAWSDWSPVGDSSCPSPTALVRPPDIIQSRSRRRTCTMAGLRPDEQCPTLNSEHLGKECPYCQGKGQILIANSICVKDVFLTDKDLSPTFDFAFSRLFNTMATRCNHPYTEPGNYSNSRWMLGRDGVYPNYCKEFNKLYDSLPWSDKETARFRISYSVDPFKFPRDWKANEQRIVFLRKRKFDDAWANHQKLYTWITTHCIKSNDCLNFLFTPDLFVNYRNANQQHWNDYKVLDDFLNNSPTMNKPLMIGGRPGNDNHYGVYYEKDSFPPTFKDYAKDRQARCRKKWPNYLEQLRVYVCNPRKTGTWPCGAGESHKCSSLFARYTDKNGRQIERKCLGVLTPRQDIKTYGPLVNECLNHFWGFPDDEK